MLRIMLISLRIHRFDIQVCEYTQEGRGETPGGCVSVGVIWQQLHYPNDSL